MQVDRSPPFIQQLTDISKASKESHWIFRNLRVVKIPNNPLLLKQFNLEQEIDLEESRKLLYQIRKIHITTTSWRLVILYNSAITVFNTYYKNNPLKLIVLPILDQLNHESLRTPVLSFTTNYTPVSKTNKLAEYLRSIEDKKTSELLYECNLGMFEQCGGKVIFIPTLPPTEQYSPLIPVEDQKFYCVCLAGQIRSATLRFCLKELKNRWDLPIKIHKAHGTVNGYDRESWPPGIAQPNPDESFADCFLEAFGFTRDKRFGKKSYEKNKDNPQVIRDYFLRKFYKSHGKPQVFMTFWNSGFEVIRGLLESNLTMQQRIEGKANSELFKNVTVVFIPERDKISRCTISDEGLMWLQLMLNTELQRIPSIRKSYEQLTNAQKRQILWTLTNQCERNQDFYLNLKHFYTRITEMEQHYGDRKRPDILERTFQIEAFRAYYWRWSGLFQPVKPNIETRNRAATS